MSPQVKSIKDKEVNTAEPLPREIFILDAPGLNGMGPDCFGRFKRYIDNGGQVFHKARCDDSGSIEFCEPNGMWPSEQVK